MITPTTDRDTQTSVRAVRAVRAGPADAGGWP
jgi:hypothetical protein